MRLWLDRRTSPIGTMLILLDEAGQVRALDFEDFEARMLRLLRLHHGSQVSIEARLVTPAVAEALDAFFDGELDRLAGLSVATGGTAFQRGVWRALRGIPPGRTMSYGELAVTLGRPSASRAVGMANGANPIALVVPCHRVIGQSGALTGYAGGLWRKRWLLEHEGRHAPGRQGFLT